jgi:hypothetical protein
MSCAFEEQAIKTSSVIVQTRFIKQPRAICMSELIKSCRRHEQSVAVNVPENGVPGKVSGAGVVRVTLPESTTLPELGGFAGLRVDEPFGYPSSCPATAP